MNKKSATGIGDEEEVVRAAQAGHGGQRGSEDWTTVNMDENIDEFKVSSRSAEECVDPTNSKSIVVRGEVVFSREIECCVTTGALEFHCRDEFSLDWNRQRCVDRFRNL